MLVAFFVLAMSALGGCDISLPELEFLVGQMSFGECQHLADALRVDSGASNVEGVTCLDELIRLHYALKNEGPNIVRGVFKHKLNQMGRSDLAQWLSLEKDPEVLTRSKNGAEEEQVPIEGKTGPLEISKRSATSWCEVAVTIALLYTGALLVWLTVRVILCKMKKHFRDKGGYFYHPAPQQWSPPSPQWSPPSRQWSPPRQKWPPHDHQQPPSQQWSPHGHQQPPSQQWSPPAQARAVPSQHHYHPPPTSRPTTSTSLPQMAGYDPQ